MEEYHELADAYLDRLVSKLEGLSEQREDVDVEYNVHTSLSPFPPLTKNDYSYKTPRLTVFYKKIF